MSIIKQNGDGSTSDLSKELHSFAEISGRQLGVKDQPKTLDEYKAHFLNVIEAKIQMYIDQVEHDKKPLSARVIANQTQNLKNEKKGILHSSLFDKEAKYHALGHELEGHPYSKIDRSKYYLLKLVVILLSFSESILVYQALRFTGIPTFGALCIAKGVGLGIAIITEYLAQYIKKANTVIIAWIRACGITLLMGVVFLGLATLRSIGMYNESLINNQMYHLDSPLKTISPFVLAAFSTGMFLIGLLISLRYGMTKDEKKLMEASWQLTKDRKKLDNDMKAIRKEIQKLDDTAHDISCSAVKVHDDTRTIESLLVRIAESAQAHFGKVNMNHRQDGQCPEFLSRPPKLNLTFFQNKIIQEYNEKSIN
jgi:hypothetical protein